MTGPRFLGLRGTITLRIIGACPEEFLMRLVNSGVRFRNYRKEDELTAYLVIPAEKLSTARAAAKKTMCQLEIAGVSGLIPGIRAMGLRILMPIWLVLLTLGVFWLQGHMLFFRVEGNTTLPDLMILDALEQCGVGFFTPEDQVDLNLLKNQMISRLPELSFLTINHHGPIAQVVVREREEKPILAGSAAPANILAAKDGLITSVTATGGSQVIRPGDFVTKGQLLISGVTNLDKTLMISRAEGEVYARTWNATNAVTADELAYKRRTGRETRVFAVTFGKKKIKFYKTSGISYGNYDKMTTEKPLTLPGGYTLPASLTVTVFREYTVESMPVDKAAAEDLLEQCVRQQLLGSMTAGSIQNVRQRVRQENGCYRLSGMAECQEEIGTVVEIKD